MQKLRIAKFKNWELGIRGMKSVAHKSFTFVTVVLTQINIQYQLKHRTSDHFELTHTSMT